MTPDQRPPDPDAWRRVNEIFHLAMELPEAERDASIDRFCAGDATLAAEVRGLLAMHRRGHAASDVSTALTPAPGRPVTIEAGSQVGQYRIDRVLGRGGMAWCTWRRMSGSAASWRSRP